MRKDLVRKSLALALVMMILLTNSVEMITSVYAEDVKELEEEEVKEAEEFEENAEDESDVEIDSEEEVEPKLKEEEVKEEEFQEDAEKNELEGEAEEEIEPESEVDESETEGNTTFEDGVRKVSDEEELIEALKDNNVERIIITRDMELSKYNGRKITGKVKIEGKEDEKGNRPILTVVNGQRHFYIDTGEKVIFKNLILKDDSESSESRETSPDLTIGGGIESLKDIESLEDVEVDIEISNCEFRENKANEGGAICISNGDVNINNSQFESNVADRGGAIFTGGGKIYINNSDFESNKAWTEGGAILVENGESDIEDSHFKSNVANRGGAIFTDGGKIYINSSDFESNEAWTEGGAICISNGDVSVKDSYFESNEAWIGGAILVGNGDINIEDSHFESNRGDEGGAIYIEIGGLDIENSNFNFNEGSLGGAIYIEIGGLNIENSSFNSNEAWIRGAIYTRGGELNISDTTFQDDASLIGVELENDVEVELNKISYKGQGQFINILDYSGYDKKCDIKLENSVIESADINLLSYNMGEGVARNDEILVAYNGNLFELAESMERAETEIKLTVDKTFLHTENLDVGLFSDLEIDVNFYNNTFVNDNFLRLGNIRGLFAHNTIKTEDLEFEELEFKVGQEGIQFKNNIIIADTEGIEGQNILLKTNDETGISDVIENDLTIIEDGGPGVRKYFKPVENSKAKGFEPINNIGELSNDMLGNARTDSVTAGAVEAETVVNTPKDDPDIPSDSGSSETPKEPETPETPKEPETPEVPKEPETPEVPKEPETPEAPKEPETPEVPKEPETPKKQETPRASGGSSRGRREKIMTLIGNGGTFIEEDLSVKLNKGDKIIEPKRGNFELIGWTSKQGGKLEKSTEELQEILENLTRSEEYYALWREKTLNREDHLGYIKGYPDGRVLPENNVSREEVAAIFYRLLDDNYKSKVRRDNNDFTDVDGNRWSNVEVSTLSKAGIINGYEDGSFRPQDKITRAEVATIASRFDNLSAGEASFADIDGHWAKDYIVSASIKGWIRGYEDGSFRPNDYITRAELVTLVNNVLERKVRKENIFSGIKEFKDLDKNKWYYENMVEAINSHEYEMLEDGTEKWIKLIDKSF